MLPAEYNNSKKDEVIKGEDLSWGLKLIKDISCHVVLQYQPDGISVSAGTE
jgi:hypothetical protein